MGIIIRTGRPRKQNVNRDGAGKSRGEVCDFEFFAQQPHRRGLPKRVDVNQTEFDQKSNRAGYAVGRLWMRSILSDDQHRAGIHYAALVASYGALIGAPVPHPRSVGLAEMVSTGFDRWTADKIDRDDDQERNHRIRQQYDECCCVLSELGRFHHRGNNISKVVNRVCVLEQDWIMSEAEIGDLRLGLNAVGKVLEDH